ncbi:hypothetical protein BDQ17DRAFT_1428683 [Cyathus striatus]|nr:hypothetical protein BDQ17DRAFT_1428683 [Cyathus striatus]
MAKFDMALGDYINPNALLPLIPTLPTSAKSKNLPVPNPLLISPPRQDLFRALCKSYTRLADTSKGSKYVSAMGEWCKALLGMSGNYGDVDGLIGRAEMLLRMEEWEDAVRILEKAFEGSGRSDRQIHKQAKLAHPDKGDSEAKMAAVNGWAYEVLTNPELRARFDAGDDPMDPAAQAGSPFPGGTGGHPFAQFFQQGESHGRFQFYQSGGHGGQQQLFRQGRGPGPGQGGFEFNFGGF